MVGRQGMVAGGERGAVLVRELLGVKADRQAVGCGGFVNITRSTKRLVFCGSFTAGGLALQIGDGQLHIETEGRSRKFIHQVEQITFNGRDAAQRGQQVVFVTERAVFRLTDDGIELCEVAPGIDIDRDVLGQMAFVPKLAAEVRTMDERIFRPGPMGLRRDWGL